MKERPILVAVIGCIIGILWGLYFRFSIVLCYIPMLAIYYILKKIYQSHKKRQFKLLSFRRYSRYFKLFISSKIIFILIISSVIENGIVLLKNNHYENCYQNGENIQITGIIISPKIEKQYYHLYKVKVLNSKYLNLYIQVSKKNGDLAYGDKVELQGEYRKPSEQRNYGSYDDKQYLKTLKIAGRVKVNQIEVIAKKQLNPILQCANEMNLKIKQKIEENFNEEKSAILKGILLGDTQNIQEEIKENFQISNISHILAISGMHISYIIIGIQLLINRIIGKKRTKIITIIVLILYAFLTGFSPSIVRAVIMGIITLMAGIVYRKSDMWNSIAISLLGILLYNPFLILNIGLQLSYLGTIGIILFRPTVLQLLSHIKMKKELKVIEKIKEIIAVSLSAQIMILPVILYHFNTLGIYFLITNLLVSMIIGPIIIFGFFCIIAFLIFNAIAKFFVLPLNIGLENLSLISKFSKLPFSKIYLPTPNLISIILYNIGVLISNQIYFIYQQNHLTVTQKRVKNLIALFRYQFNQKKKKYWHDAIIIFFIVITIHFIPKDLEIHFVDVGQGDCTFIVTPQNKTILIDGGGNLTEEFDVGKKTLIPYLLDRGYTTIDYVIISHFDQDHVGGILLVLEELKVKNVIIGKQFEDSENLQQFLNIIKEKNIKVNIVEVGNRINIEKNIYFDVLWPSSEQAILENQLNNNALVCKFYYKNFSMLFTGDIEEETEKNLALKYSGTNILKSTVLKVAHHGSNSSSIEEFLKLVQPEIALIGVGKNNLYGHPKDEVLERLMALNCSIFRTDENGEISIIINSKGKIKERKTMLSN